VPSGKYFDLTVERALPRNYRKWAGFSGAVMFCGDLAVGVVRTVDGEWDRSLTATPIQHLLEDESFKTYWEAQRVPMPIMLEVNRFEPKAMDANLLSLIARHTYLIDRKDPVEQVKLHIKNLSFKCAPQVIAIAGLDDDEHEYLIQQLADNRHIRNLLKRDANTVDVILPLPWPAEAGQIDPDEHFDTLLNVVCSVAKVPAPAAGQPPPLVQLRKSFDDGVTSRAFCVLIRRKIAISGHGRLFQKLLDFWQQLGDGLPIFLFLCLAWDDPQESQSSHPLNFLFTSRKPDKELEVNLETAKNQNRLVPVGPLTEIVTDHVGPWIDELRFRCTSIPPMHLQGLRLVLQHRIGTGKRARQVATDLGDLLQRL
jgi:hypothetical protein